MTSLIGRSSRLLVVAVVLLSAARAFADVGPVAAAPRRWKGIEPRMAELERVVEERAHDPVIIGHLYERFELRDEEVQPRKLKGWLQKLAGSASAHPILRGHARLLLVRLAIELAELNDVAALRHDAGVVEAFAVVGPFENTGGGGMAADPGPDENPRREATFDGLSRSVAWRVVDVPHPSGVLALHDHLWPSDDVLGYALVYVRSDVEQDAALRVGASDQLQVRFNGKLVLDADEMHSVAPDQHVVALRLKAGFNRLLFKVGQLKGGWNLLARLTAPAGGPLSGVTFSTDAAHEAEARAASFTPAGSPAVDPLVESTARLTMGCVPAKNGGGCSVVPRAQLLEEIYMLRRALRADDERARPMPRKVVLGEASRLSPDDPYLLTALAEEQHDDVNRSRDLYEQAVKSDPRFAPAWLGLGKLRLRQELFGEARKALRMALEADGKLSRAAVDYFEERADHGPDPDAAVRETAEAARKRPSVAALEGLTRMEQNRGAHARSLAVAEKLRALVPGNRSARTAVVEVAQRRGDLEMLAREWQTARTLDPHGESAVESAAEVLAAQGKLKEAEELLMRFAAAHPDSSDAQEALGALRQRLNDVEGALAAYRASLAVKPQNAGLRRHVDVLSGAAHFEERYSLDVAALAAAPPPPGAEEAGGYVIGHVVAHRLYDNGLTTQVVDIAWRLLDRAKAPLLKEAVASYVPGRESFEALRAERITAAGEVFQAQVREQDPSGRQMGMYTDRRRVTADFGALNAGDIVRFRYRIDASGERNLFGDFFGLVEYAQEWFPKSVFEVVVEAPRTRPLYHRSVRLPAVTSEQHPDRTAYRLTARNLPAVVVEPNMPPYTEVGGYVMLSSYAKWDDMGRWYASLVRDQLALDENLKRIARELVQGARDDDEKIRRIHRYVLRNTRYVGIELGIHGWKPYRVTQVHARGYGDCKDKASLLVAMLRELGIPARLTLLRTWDHGPLADLPSMWSFNHAIAYVPGRKLFLDGTAEFSGMTELPAMDQEAFAITIDIDTGAVERVTPALMASTQNTNTSDYVIEVGADGSARLKGEERFAGLRAPDERIHLQDPALQEQTLEREFSALYPGADVESVQSSPPTELDAPMLYRFSATVPSFAQRDGEAFLLPISLYPHELEREYAPGASRTQDLVVNFPYLTRNRMRFVLPRGFVARGVPSSSKLATPHFEFQQTVTPTANGYVVEEVAHFKTRRIPAKAYPQLRQALIEADRRMRLKVRLLRGSASAGAASTEASAP